MKREPQSERVWGLLCCFQVQEERFLHPLNAFIIFSNEWCQKLVTLEPKDRNKDITLR